MGIRAGKGYKMTGIADFFAMGGYAFYVWTAYGLSFLIIVSVLLWSSYEQRRVTRESFAIAIREQDRKLKRTHNRNKTKPETP